jgi:hypothetical protein
MKQGDFEEICSYFSIILKFLNPLTGHLDLLCSFKPVKSCLANNQNKAFLIFQIKIVESTSA